MSNVPGMDYLTRVGKFWNDLLLRQSKASQEVWNELKAGKYKHETMYKAWAGAVEDYYELTVEAWRGPGYISRPAWLYFTFSKSSPTPLDSTARLDRTESMATNPDMTDFASLQGKGARPANGDAGLYQQCELNGNEIRIKLDRDAVAGSPPGQYISFVFGKNRGPEAPLVIVMLRINE